MKKQVLVDDVAYDAKALELFAEIAEAYATFANLVADALCTNRVFIDRHEINIISECDNACLVVDFIGGAKHPYECVDNAEKVVKIIDAAFKESDV